MLALRLDASHLRFQPEPFLFQFADRPRQYLGDARRESLAEAARVLKRRLGDPKQLLASVHALSATK